MSEENRSSGEMKIQSPFLKKLDNFWYHYKWHTIIGLFVVITLSICLLQMCTKQKADVEIVYAGPHSLDYKQSVLTIQDSLSKVAEDVTGDGKVSVVLTTYWINDDLTNDDDAQSTNESLAAKESSDNKTLFSQEILTGNFSVCLLSPAQFRYLCDAGRLAPIEGAAEEAYVRDSGGKINAYGVVLSQTDLGKLPGLSELPKDTVLCICKPTAQSFWWFGKKQQTRYENAESFFKSALAYTIE